MTTKGVNMMCHFLVLMNKPAIEAEKMKLLVTSQAAPISCPNNKNGQLSVQVAPRVKLERKSSKSTKPIPRNKKIKVNINYQYNFMISRLYSYQS